MPVVSMNTLGARRLKTAAESRRGEAGAGEEDESATWDSKVDMFNKRRELLYEQKEGKTKTDIVAAELRCVSLLEFNWKYYLKHRKIHRSCRPVCLSLTPAHSADCANVTHERHEAYARTAVVGYWRMMPTRERRAMLRDAVGSRLQPFDERIVGATRFEESLEVAGGCEELFPWHQGFGIEV